MANLVLPDTKMNDLTTNFLVTLTFLATVGVFQMALAAFDLPSGANDLLNVQPVNMEFNCEGRKYGYYGDINNDCQLFHICLPIEDADGNVIDTNHWTFLCSNGTIFDQQTLSCNYISDSFPCEESESLYGTVMFGLQDDELFKKL
ncbi:uncharacterized protein LOC131880806 [Tigriopus californicus]|nr:uncharacterized protein LOC131880806 [Tigriopus californicus]